MVWLQTEESESLQKSTGFPHATKGTHVPLEHRSFAPQLAVQAPPQPSEPPRHLPAQSGVQATQCPEPLQAFPLAQSALLAQLVRQVMRSLLQTYGAQFVVVPGAQLPVASQVLSDAACPLTQIAYLQIVPLG